MNIQLLQAYVDTALAELGISNHGLGRVKARLDEEDPDNEAWVMVHRLANGLDFSFRLLTLVQRQKWIIKVHESYRLIKVLT